MTGRFAILPALAAGVIGALGLPDAGRAQSLLTLPPGSEQTARVAGANDTLALPIGPWTNGAIPSLPLTGTVSHQAWRVPLGGKTGGGTLALMQTLRADLAAKGFLPIFTCETDVCGGFDFRYGTRILPEPDMHVDLGDFRFLSAVRGRGAEAEYVALLVSRAGDAAFVQLSQISAAAKVVAAPAPDQPVPDPPLAGGPEVAPAAPASDISGMLESQGRAVLEDVIFASGAAELETGRPASLAALAGYLAGHPAARVVIVGHTDASGSLAANVALSRRRAQAVADRLLSDYGVPPAQVSADGVGFLAPRASNLTEEGRRQNRRVEAVLASTP